jgi:hypothetical protein
MTDSELLEDSLTSEQSRCVTEVWRTKVRFHFMAARDRLGKMVDRQRVYYRKVDQHFQVISPKAMRRFLYTDLVAIHPKREIDAMMRDVE